MAIRSLARRTVGNRQSTITTAHTCRTTAFPNPWRQMTINVFLREASCIKICAKEGIRSKVKSWRGSQQTSEKQLVCSFHIFNFSQRHRRPPPPTS